MDEALIEYAEHDIDGQDRAADQQALVGERILEGLGRAGESGPDILRHADLLF